MINSSTAAALFDLDGVIIDTETQYTVFWDSMCEKYLHKTDYGKVLKGMTLERIYKTFFSEQGIDTDRITDQLNEFEASMDMKYIPGAEQFIMDLKNHGIKRAVVTSSNQPKMESVYRCHPEFKGMFDRILTAEMFTRSKPAPDCYLLGAQIFGTASRNCFVFEDSFNGLKAGRDAGMTVIGLATTNSAEAIRPYADSVIPDFTGMTAEKMLAMAEKAVS